MSAFAEKGGESRQDAAANIAVALFYLQREALATGLNQLAGTIEDAVREASDYAARNA